MEEDDCRIGQQLQQKKKTIREENNFGRRQLEKKTISKRGDYRRR